MLNRLRGLFARYAVRHLVLAAPGRALVAADGSVVGAVETVRLERGRLVVTGWSLSPRLRLRAGTAEQVLAPNLPRPGLALPPGAPPTPGFRAELPDLAPLTVEVDCAGRRLSLALRPPSAARRRRARWLLLPAFARDLARAAPAALAWARHHALADRQRVKRALRLDDPAPAPALDGAVFGPASGPDPHPGPDPGAAPRLTIVLPVYDAFEMLQQALDRVLRHTDLDWRMVLVEDASPDPRVRPFLRDWAASREAERPGRVVLIEHDTNKGFLGAVNAAFARAAGSDDPLVLLNSDAFVPEGWASRLVAPILADPAGVASVTPMSNDAEIFGVPRICVPGPLAPGSADRIDAVARRFAAGAGLAEAPTGVGFCMAINPRFLARVPGFDPAFGRGYGEEVDWCQRVRALGGRHLGLPGLFVEHRGGASFGSAEKRRLVQANGAMISARYPRYDAEVQDFIQTDPLATPRLALALAWAAAERDGPLPVYLAHSMGGGAEHYLAGRIAGDLAARGRAGAAAVIRVGGARRWQVEVHGPGGVTGGQTDDSGLLRRLFDPLDDLALVYSCGVGDPDPVALPDLLLDLAGVARRARIEVLMHDYFPLGPSLKLLDSRGRFDGVPAADSADPAHRTRRPDGRTVTLAEWRAAWGRLLAAPETVVVAFSDSSRGLVAAAYPAAAARIRVQPHRIRPVPALPPPVPGAPPVIGVLGDIGLEKGAGLVSRLSARLATLAPEGRPGLVLIGNIDPAFPLAAATLVHGSYELADLPALVARYGVTCWLIPSIWPETFCYALHEALATGLPVWALDLGAQGDAVRAAANGRLLPADPGAAVAALLAALAPPPG